MMGRASRRRFWGKRQLKRETARIARRVLELDERGFGPAAIASSTGLPRRTVRAVLEEREEEGSCRD